MKAAKPGEEIAAFLICDHKTLRKYGLGCVPPFPMPIGRHVKTGYLMRGATLAELAAQAGIDARGLEATVAQFNASAATGQDTAFGKGSRAYNRFQGDALHGPNPCIGPIEQGPFYAIKMVIGDLGTYAGIKTDAQCPRARRRRPSDRRALCRRQRHGEHHGRQLSRRRHHARARADLRLYRGPPYRGRIEAVKIMTRDTSSSDRRMRRGNSPANAGWAVPQRALADPYQSQFERKSHGSYWKLLLRHGQTGGQR